MKLVRELILKRNCYRVIKYFRQLVDKLLGDPSSAISGWEPRSSLEDLVNEMIKFVKGSFKGSFKKNGFKISSFESPPSSNK